MRAPLQGQAKGGGMEVGKFGGVGPPGWEDRASRGEAGGGMRWKLCGTHAEMPLIAQPLSAMALSTSPEVLDLSIVPWEGEGSWPCVEEGLMEGQRRRMGGWFFLHRTTAR